MNATDNRICRDVITTLKSAKYSQINYLFLEPVDVQFFPTYLSIVDKPMDLGTASKNLEAGMYTTKDSFFRDVALCFENAEKFHKDKVENGWIIAQARDMKKALNKERKRTEKKLGGSTVSASSSAGGDATMAPGAKKPKLKLSLGKSSDKKKSSAVASPKADTASSGGSGSGATVKSKPTMKFSLKMKSKTAAATSTDSHPSTGASASTGAAAGTNAAPDQPAKPKRPMLKLKISTKSTPAPGASPKASAGVKTPTTTSSTKSPSGSATKKSSEKSKTKSTSTPKSTPSAQSRGKELPTAVAEAKANKKAEAKKAAAAKRAEKAEAKKAAAAAAKAAAAAEAAAPTSVTKPKAPTLKISTPKATAPPATSGQSRGKETGKTKQKSKGKVISATLSSTASGSTTKSTKNSNAKKVRISISSSRRIDMGSGAMAPQVKAQCYKVISGLKRKEYLEIRWFLKPVNDPTVIDDYRAKIKNPTDIGTLTSRLDKDMYATVSDFLLDLRRIFGNCLRFNALAGDSFRPVAVSMAATTEDLMHLFVQSHSSKPIYPKLLYCWKSCVEVLDKVLTLKNPEDGYPTAHYFLHPVSFYFGDQLPPDYLERVQTPIDFGTITSRLIEGEYQKVQDFADDCRMVTANCKAFYAGKPEGALFNLQATRLEQFLSPLLDGLERYDSSQQGLNAKKASLNPYIEDLAKPPKSFMTSLLQFLRSATYTDRATKLVEPASRLFEHPVDTNIFSDYLQFVKNPICLTIIAERIESGAYIYAEDFEHDVNLIFKNCEAYNVPKRNLHIVNLAKYCAKSFRKQYSTRIRAFDAGNETAPSVEEKPSKKRPSPKNAAEAPAPPAKRIRKSPATVAPVAKPQTSTTIKVKAPKKTLPRIVIRTDGPLPRHVAVAKIKQEFSTRRPHKNLEHWEGTCSRFFRELKRHPWIASSKRFVFDAPVPLLHPEIKEAYAAMIRDPMDLTTAECKLLQGGIYQGPQEFIDDIARVFANAVTFNKSGQEQGDPTSCAYFDASRHLLRYTRWLSLESLSQFLWDDSQSEGAHQVGPIPQWALSNSNRKDAQKEMEEIVMKCVIDKSDEGDRFTWMESECEKLLKSLRHQSDNKRMCFFLQPNFPGDYFAYISNPMDWETCYRRLQDRKYDMFGDIVSDLRLIFSNALKYNGRMKDVDPASKFAYDSAVTMSEKLEIAIQRMLVTVSDRVEREKVEQVVLDREHEIAQKEEEERVRKEWQQERENGSNGNDAMHKTPTSTLKAARRRKELDFDFPFYEEDDGNREQSAMEVLSQQKLLYEEQLRDRIKMDHVTRFMGQRVYHSLQERSCAIRWAKQLTERIEMTLTQKPKGASGEESIEKGDHLKASCVASLLTGTNRSQIKLSLQPKKKKRKRARFTLD